MDQKALLEELIRGRNAAAKLLGLMLPPENSAEEFLFKEVLGSFSNLLSELDSKGQLAAAATTPESTTVKVEVTTSCSIEEMSKKRKAQAPRRNSHKRRLKYTCKQIRKTIEDGHTWRKYGQKDIFGSNFPRSYFRCTHKHDRHCQAQKQVQLSEEDPSMYVITYLGEHTCMQSHTAADSPAHKSPYIIDFAAKTTSGESNYGAGRQVEAVFGTAAGAALPTPKQETEEEVLSSLTPGTSSSSDPTFDYLPELEDQILVAANCGESILDQYDAKACWVLEFDDVNWDQDLIN